MARKTNDKTNNKNPQPKRAIDDNFVAPKARKQKTTTLAEALAESGETLEELIAVEAPAEADRPTRPVGTSNLANTIRAHRQNYSPMLHPNGKKTQNNGDPVAILLLSISLPTLQAFGGTRYGRTYDHLNPGHARMCLGNLIRASVGKGEADVLEWLYANQPKVEEAEEEAA